MGLNESINEPKQLIAYQKIKNDIIRNEIEPGTLLVERQLCSVLGISRTPVREALRNLANEGLVEFIPKKGMFVSNIRIEDIIEIFDLRIVLEGLAAKLCTLYISKNGIDMLRQNIEIQDKCIKERCNEEFLRKDVEFHKLYIEGSNNKRLQTFLGTIMDQITRLTYTTVRDIDLSENSLKHHAELLSAIENGNSIIAEELAKKHLESVKNYHLNRMIRR